jgi:pSer/pThr/pTyr-binding forkhead associated (FHA) protein
MTDQVLDILKLVLLALLYLFFARVLWAVWSEVRQPDARTATDQPAPAAHRPTPGTDPTASTPRNWRANTRSPKPPRGRRGVPGRLEVLEPKERRGTTFAIGVQPITVGRDAGSTVMIADDTYVSGHHATIAISGDDVVVIDAGSKNGTYLNGQKISHQRIVHTGDRLQIGATILEAR